MKSSYDSFNERRWYQDKSILIGAALGCMFFFRQDILDKIRSTEEGKPALDQLESLKDKAQAEGLQIYNQIVGTTTTTIEAGSGGPPLAAEQLAALQASLSIKPDACPSGRDQEQFRMYIGDPSKNKMACLALKETVALGDSLMIPLKASDMPGYVGTNLAESVGSTPDEEFCKNVLQTITPYAQQVVNNEPTVPVGSRVQIIIRMSAQGISPCDSDYLTRTAPQTIN